MDMTATSTKEEASKQRISVVLAGPSTEWLENWKFLLLQEPATEVVAQATTWAEIVVSVRRLRPRILVCGFEMYTDTNYAAMLALHRECPGTRVVLLFDEMLGEERYMHALAIGASGYVSHDQVRPHLAKAIRGVDQGEAWMPRKMLGKMVELALD